MNTQCNATTTYSDAGLHASPKTWLNAASFDQLLGWLGPDSETAGRKYEDIRGRMIVMFRAQRCVFAEDLADETFERVEQKLAFLTESFTGDPARYIYGVARKIYLEYQHKVRTARAKSSFFYQPSADKEKLEHTLLRLDEALNAIPKSNRDLILSYYNCNRNKMDERRGLAQQFGLSPNALRLRVFRIRREIKNHML